MKKIDEYLYKEYLFIILMSKPTFLISNYIESYPELEDFRKQIYTKNILSKDYVDEGLFLIYHKYDQPIISELDRECRSLIIDRTTKKIVSYSCDSPLINNEAMEYMISNPQKEGTLIYKCYEGSLLSVFNFNEKWYVSTRRCLNSNDSIWGTEDKSHFTMFMEVLNESGYKTLEEFTNKLDKTLCYYFVLIHCNNKNIVDYEPEFGKNYKKLCLVIVRESENQIEKELKEEELTDILDKNIFLPNKIESLKEFDELNKNEPYSLPPKSEGVIIKVFDEKSNKNKLLKLQTINYQFAKSTGSEQNIFKGLIHLYQNNKLIDFFSQNTISTNYKKIVNPLNTSESYDTLGLVVSMFKVCTSELFELFKILYDIKTGKPNVTEKKFYDLLPKEYKDVLYNIRGIYFKKKAEFIKTQTINHLQIDDIYQMLKNMTTDNFCSLIKMRKLMYNWIKVNPDVSLFGKLSGKCDKVQFKLTAIYTNKLFPQVMPDEYPKIDKIIDNPEIIKE